MHGPGDRREPEEQKGPGWLEPSGRCKVPGGSGPRSPGPSQPGEESGFCSAVGGEASAGFRCFVRVCEGGLGCVPGCVQALWGGCRVGCCVIQARASGGSGADWGGSSVFETDQRDLAVRPGVGVRRRGGLPGTSSFLPGTWHGWGTRERWLGRGTRERVSGDEVRLAVPEAVEWDSQGRGG